MHLPVQAVVLFLTSVATAAPLASPSANKLDTRADSRGSYIVPGLGARKQAILDAGGNSLDIAIAMLETENMQTDYAYGDNKSEDAANFGLFKQNWGVLRKCASRAGFEGQTQSEWNNGAKLNSDIYADVASRWDCQDYLGYQKWMAGHRNGETGVNNPDTADIKRYTSAIEWLQAQIDSSSLYQSDDTRFWVDVTAI